MTSARTIVPAADFDAGLAFFTETIGFRLDQISPADDPSTAVLSGFGTTLRLDRRAAGVAHLELLTDDESLAGTIVTGPNGNTISYRRLSRSYEMPALVSSVTVSRFEGSDDNAGRAGMRYRDLVPDRFGGRVIASHISVPGSGPVPDYVHHHDIKFQIIFCRRGAATLVYEDQGEPFRFEAGDCVVQPPFIRHRVLHSFDDLEVVEIGSPARHDTNVDHDMTLPTPTVEPDRVFGGQRFVHHRAAGAPWQTWLSDGFEFRDTGIDDATGGVGGVRVIRAAEASPSPSPSPSPSLSERTHDDEFVLWFVLSGAMTVAVAGDVDGGEVALSTDDSITIPAGAAHALTACSADLEFLEVRIH